MSVRTDNANLIITIDAKESVEYQKAVQRSRELTRNIRNMEVGTDEYNAALREQVEISRRLSQTDYSRLSLRNLQDRRRALQEQIRLLPQVTATELGLEQELQRVNQALAENARRTRATSNEMSNFTKLVGGAALLSGLRSVITSVFDQTKVIDSLNKAYEKIIPEEDKLARSQEYLSRLADSYGLKINDLRDQYLKYTASAKASTLSLADQELVFESVAKASSTLGLSTETQGRAFTALQQIMSKGKVSAEELKGQLGDALPGAVVIMAKALGVTTGELQKMLEKGEVMAEDALPKFAIELQKAYGVDQVTRIDNLASAQNRYENKLTELVSVVGGALTPAFLAMFNLLQSGVVYAIAFAKAIGSIPQFIRENDVAIKAVILGLVLFNSQMILAGANSLRLAAIEKGRAIVTGAVTLAQNLLNAAMTANPIGLVIKAIGLLVVGFGILYAKSETVRAGIAGLGNVAKEIFTIIKEAVGSFVNGFNQLKEGNFRDALSSFGDAITKTNPIGIAFTQGQRLKDAFNKGYNDKLAAEKAKKEAEKQAQDLVKGVDDIAAQSKTPTSASDDKKKKKTKEDKEKQFSEVPKSFTISSTAQLELENRLKAIDEAAKREQLILQEKYAKDLISEEQFNVDKLRITSSKLAERIALLDQYGDTETDQRKELNIQLLNAEKDLLEARAKLIVGDGPELTDLKRQFIDRIISEEEFAQQKLDIERAFLEEKLLLLENDNKITTDVYKKLQDDLIKVQEDTNKRKEDNEKRSQKIREEIQKEAFGVSSDILDLGIELLGKDEAARKKNASAIKAFESAKVIVNATSEIASIWKGFTETLGPIAGPIFAAIRTVIVAARAGQAIGKINAQQFKYGGLTRGGIFQGPSHDFGGVKFSVGGQVNEAEGGEAIINKRSTEMFADELNAINQYNGYGRPLFEGGGVVRLPNTVPTGLTSSTLGRAATDQAAVQADPRIDMLVNALTGLTQMMPAALSNIKANVNYFDIENKGSEINEIRDLARY